MSPRLWALAGFLVLGAALVAVLVTTTPGRPLAAAASPDATRDFSAAEIRREVDFHDALRPPALTALAVGLAASGLLGLTSWGARLVASVARLGGDRWQITVVLGVLAVTVLLRLTRLPFAMRAETVRRRFGLSNQDWAGWALDVAKSTAVGVAVLSVALLTLYAVVRWSPDRWWVGAAVAGAGLVVVASFGYPLVVEPLFNRFTSLPQGELRTSLLELAERDGVAVDDVLVADASRRTTALNAYVSGIGATRRIVVFDTLLESATPQEVRLVVAHELGHVVENDVRDGTLVGALAVAAAMPLLYLLFSWTPLLRRAGVTTLADPRSLALVAFAVTALSLMTAPVQTLVSRRVEARADLHSLELTEDVATFVATERRLALANLSDLEPNRVLYLLFATHPSAPERIALARAWAERADRRPPVALQAP
ncbi:MAG TPA: M48 family metallopeptidase [Mycobacteriales bacterium]|nr:M48 family metallopeptidase [Mycobacteriales bacterium]